MFGVNPVSSIAVSAQVIPTVVNYGLLLSENSNLADALSFNPAQYINTITENSSIADVLNGIFSLIMLRTEDVQMADSSTQGSTFGQAIAENIILGDLSSQLSTFIVARTEGMTAADVLAMVRGSFFTVTENANIAELRTITAQFAAAVAENINMADSSTQVSTFKQAITENMYLLADPIARGWIKINDNQTPNWVIINNQQ